MRATSCQAGELTGRVGQPSPLVRAGRVVRSKPTPWLLSLVPLRGTSWRIPGGCRGDDHALAAAGCAQKDRSPAGRAWCVSRRALTEGDALPHVEVFGFGVVADQCGGGLFGFELELEQ